MPRGRIIAVLGPDGSGKSTVIAGLVAREPNVRRAHLGLWTHTRWNVLERVPGGGLALRLGRLVRGTVSARWHRACGRTVVLDRVANEHIILGSADPSIGGRLLRGASSRLMPALDRVAVLDAPSSVLGSRTDEYAPEQLERQRRRYLAFARRTELATVVDVTHSPYEVTNRLRELVAAA